jgi:hypothetical protein
MMRASSALVNGVYRGAARLSGRFIGGCGLLESAFVHRSVASGEIAFGRSDIDLVLVAREGACGADLLGLYERVRQLRRFNPAVGHMAVQDSAGVASEVEADTYLGSIDRRSALTVYGRPVEVPALPVRAEDAIRRFAFWQDSYLSTAMRLGDRRNLGKIAADMWNACAVSRGRLQVPFVTRWEAERHWLASGQAGQGHGAARCFRMAKRLHDEILPPLERLGEPCAFRRKLAPRFRDRAFLVLPEADAGVRPEALEPGSFVTTPELLHLYLHFVNPFMDWVLPDALRRAGFQPPSPEAFTRACLFYGHTHTTRNPGFMHPHAAAPGMILGLLEHCAEYLRDGEAPPPPAPEQAEASGRRRIAVEEYYLREFDCTYGRTARVWEELRGLLEQRQATAAAGA